MRIAVTGAAGQVGSALVPRLTEEGHDVVPLTRAQLDLSELGRVAPVIAGLEADWVVHLAAYTQVDGAEDESELAFRVNRDASGRVAKGAMASGSRLLYLSTDYVFDGRAQEPYTEDHPPAPATVYGRSKWEGEQAVHEAHEVALVVRTSWVMGGVGRHFARTILGLARTRSRLAVVDDQHGRPTWVPDLVDGLAALIHGNACGTFHLANDGVATWHGLTVALVDAARDGGAKLAVQEIAPVSSSALDQRAPRPAYSVLDCGHADRVHQVRLPHWRESLPRSLEGCR